MQTNQNGHHLCPEVKHKPEKDKLITGGVEERDSDDRVVTTLIMNEIFQYLRRYISQKPATLNVESHI